MNRPPEHESEQGPGASRQFPSRRPVTLALLAGLAGIVFAALPEWPPLADGHLAGWLAPFLAAALGVALGWFSAARRAGARLRKAEARWQAEIRLKADLKHALDEHALVSMADVRGRIVQANSRFCAVSGYSEAELLGQDHRIVNSGHHDAAYFKAMWRTVARGQTWQGEFCNRAKSGRLYWVSTTIVPRLDEAGKPFQYIAIRTEITEQKRLQSDAVELRDRLERILAASPTVTYALENPDDFSVCTYISDNVERITGHSAGAMLADPGFWQRHLHPLDRHRVLAEMKRLTERGEVRLEYRFLKANKEYAWMRDTAKAVRDASGRVEAIVGAWTDITDSKSQEQELVRLRRAVDASVDMIFIADSEGFIEFVNPSFCRFTGWAFREIVGRAVRVLRCGRLSVLNTSELSDGRYEEVMATLARGESWSGRLVNRRKLPAGDGPASGLSDPCAYWAEVSITPILDDAGNPRGYVSIQRDITALVAEEERQELEREATAARLRIAELLHGAEPLDARCASVLECLFQLRGLDARRKGGILVRQENGDALEWLAVRGDFDEDFLRQERKVGADGCPCGRAAFNGELLILDSEAGGPVPGASEATPCGHYVVPLAGNEETVGVLFLHTDPNPSRDPVRLEFLRQVGQMLGLAILQVRASEALRRARDAAFESSRLKSDFLANMSHEIRTPMNGVLGMLDLLRGTALSPQQREFVGTAHHSAESLLDVINDILDFSKLEAGKLQLENVGFDFRRLVEEASALLAGPAHAKRLELTCFVAPEVPERLRGDPTRLRQILTNLVGNAVKFTEEGEIAVEAVCVEQDAARAVLRVAVRDTGIGIDPAARSRLFQPFTQADGTTTRRFGGTGLGLAIARDLVVHMGGEIGLESTPGKGSLFWFRIALEKAAGGGEPLDRHLAEGRRVLVVDDSATNRQILDCFLRDWGALPELADCASGALGRLNSARTQGILHDLVILDLQMPEMDGLELARAMQENPALRGIPKILLSSGGIVEPEAARAAGIAALLSKPVRRSQLYDALATALVGRALADAVPKLEKPGPRAAGEQTWRVLLVEDNLVNRKVAQAMLGRLGAGVAVAGDGREALETLRRESFDLVLMDCQMPGLDGYEATRAWRAVEQAEGRPRLPIVALTANALEADRDACLAVGMDDHLGKPFTLDTLSRMLTRWLGGREDADPRPPLWDRDGALERTRADRKLVDAAAGDFVGGDARRLLGGLAGAAGEPGAVAAAARALEQSARQLCAPPVADLALRLAQAAEAGDLAGADFLAARLGLAVRRLWAEIAAERNLPGLEGEPARDAPEP
jgi:PAS domain S-box-containing protein